MDCFLSIIITNYVTAAVFDTIWISALLVIITRIFYDNYGSLKVKWIKHTPTFFEYFLIVLLFPVFLAVQAIRGIYRLVAYISYKRQLRKEAALLKNQPDISEDRKETPLGFSDFAIAKRQAAESRSKTYERKTLMTDCELRYYEAIKNCLKEGFTLQPQIPLSSIIRKKNSKYNTPFELYRTIDFALLNAVNEIVCLIEINDATHFQPKRRDRDKKVQAILQETGFPLATLWTHKGIDINYIKTEINNAIKNGGRFLDDSTFVVS